MPEMSSLTAPPGPGFTPVARVLTYEEWCALTPDFGAVGPHQGFVVVVEDGGPGGRILAQWGAMLAMHVEGLAIIPEAQGHAGVARALLNAMITALLAQGVPEVLTQAESVEVAAMIKGAGGARVPGTTWVLPIAPTHEGG